MITTKHFLIISTIIISILSVVSSAKIINYPGNDCGSWGYSPMDFDRNCYVDINDLSIFLLNWMECTDPQIVGCSDEWMGPKPPFRDISIPQAPPKATEWTRNAVIVQPWAKSQWDLIAQENIAGMPEHLTNTYGFNAIILAPPTPHSYFVGDPAYYLTDEELKNGIAAYNAAGFKIILYSSISNCGHSQAWQTGQLAAIHPEWSQVDELGATQNTYGFPWLCPNTGAFDYVLDYTKNLITEYQADAIMLDNSQFFTSTANGLPTCYCASCQTKFKDYITQRFGSYCFEIFGVSAENITIPPSSQEATPLYRVWQHWRNWTYGNAIEQFRAQIYPTMLFANTAYLYGNWYLATDLQLQHEDVVLSETRWEALTDVSDKLILGKALSYERPVWNYLGTFSESDYTYLRSPFECSRMTAATISQIVCPWLVYYGFDTHDTENEPSRHILAELFGFKAQNPGLFNDLTEISNVGVVIATRTHNYYDNPMIPACLYQIRDAGIPVRGLFDLLLADLNLSGISVIAAEYTGFLSQTEAEALVSWMQAGGTLVATPELGLGDDLGRPRSESIIAQLIGRPLTTGSVGDGSLVIVASPNDILSAVQSAITNERFIVSAGSVEVTPYASPAGDTILHVVNYGADMVSGTWTIQVPDELGQNIQNIEIYKPEEASALPVSWSSTSGHTILTLPLINAYAVIKISY